MASIIKKFVENKVEIYAAKPEERGVEYIFNQYEEGRSDWIRYSLFIKENHLFFSASSSLVFFGAFLGVVIFNFFWERFFSRNIMDIRPLFESLPLLLIFLSSAITMKNVER